VASNLVNAADKAMYESKKNGRNQVSYHALISEVDRQFARNVQQCRFSRWLVQGNHFDVNTMARILLKTSNEWQKIGAICATLRFLTSDQINEVLSTHFESDERFGETALRLGFLNSKELQFILAIQQEQPQSVKATLVEVGLSTEEEASQLLNAYMQQLPQSQSVSD
jgi:hypothetical protein